MSVFCSSYPLGGPFGLLGLGNAAFSGISLIAPVIVRLPPPVIFDSIVSSVVVANVVTGAMLPSAMPSIVLSPPVALGETHSSDLGSDLSCFLAGMQCDTSLPTLTPTLQWVVL